MKNILRVLVMLTFLGQLFSVTVDGHAYLEGQTNFRGINVIFQRVVPDSLALYRVSTDSTGYYVGEIQSGYYDVEFVKNGFSSTKLEDVPLYSNQTLSNQTLTALGLEGEIKGIITEGEYNVSDTLRVASGDSLIIEPGVTLNFNTGAAFIINGYLNAEGTGADSIVFRAVNEDWNGIILQQSPHISTINYGSIIRPKKTAILVEESSLSLSNSFVNGGIYCSSFSNLINCNISNCEMIGSIYGRSNNDFSLKNNKIIGCVGIDGGHGFLEDCVIISKYDKGLDLGWSGDFPVSATLINCNIMAATGIQANSNTKVYNSIIRGISTDYGSGIVKPYNSSALLEVFNTNVYGFETNYELCGPYLGVIVTTNANGDACDGYFNISMDPRFVDAANGDFSLQSDSPCIDAGTNLISDYVLPSTDIIGNTRIWDGDESGTSIVDMGAYEYGSSIPVSIEDTSEEIQNYQLFQNYPNPFNPVTTISYALPQASLVELNVYNLQGQLVQSLVNGRLDKGMHKAEFNGADLTTGMYIYNLKVDNKVVSSKKMMLLK